MRVPLHDFKGPITNDKTAVFLKGKGLPSGNNTAVTAASNLVKSVRDAADEDAVWTAVKSWAGTDDDDVVRLPAAITELPDFHARPNRQNVEVFDGTNQSVQVLGIGTTPDLDLTITLYDPGNDDGHAALAKVADGTMLDILVLSATTWKAENTEHIDGTALEASGFAALVVAGKPYQPGGQASDYSRLTLPLAYRDISNRIIASY